MSEAINDNALLSSADRKLLATDLETELGRRPTPEEIDAACMGVSWFVKNFLATSEVGLEDDVFLARADEALAKSEEVLARASKSQARMEAIIDRFGEQGLTKN